MSFVTDVEDVIEELSDWVVETVMEIVDAIMPDGKPFFKELPTLDEQIQEYMTLRGNPEAWTKWMAEQTVFIVTELQDSAVPPDMILSVHPVDIAQKAAIAWSAEMEDALRRPEYAILT